MIKKKKESPAAVDVSSAPTSALPTIKGDKDTFRIAGPYHILSPPIKKSMIHGHLVPTFRSATALSMLQQPHRLLTIELSSSVPRKEGEKEVQELHDNDRVILRVFRLSSDVSSPRAADGEDSVVTTTDSLNTSINANQWVEHKVYRLDEIEILKQIPKKDCVEIQLGLGNDTIVRDFRFVVPGAPNEPGMTHFCQTIERMEVLEQERAQRQLDQFQKEAFSSTTTGTGAAVAASTSGALSSNERIEILVEIVSATNLPVSDLVATDAYIVVRFGTKEIHRTGVISNNLSPIFTLFSGSLFLLSYTPEEFFKQGTSGLSFTIKDYDTVGSNDVLGTVHVTLQELLKGTGQRVPYLIDLDPTAMDASHKDEKVPLLKDEEKKSETAAESKSTSPLKLLTPTLPSKKDALTEKKKQKPPTLYLRFRKASENDVHFIKEFQHRSKSSASSHGIYANETFLSIRAMPYPKGHLLQRQEKKNQQKEVIYRVRPCPDPDRSIAETEWLTKEQIQAEAMKPSRHWVQAGAGSLGKLYLELISCDGLPNMDRGNLSLNVHKGEKTDAFACIVYEDVIVNTDVISNTLSPRWMPWCHRAFAFNIMHPSSDVFVGIFDHDPEQNPLHMVSQMGLSSLHDPIGRIVINLSHFKPDTVYLLQYPLYLGELKEHRVSSRGIVTLRLRLEFPSVRKAVLGGVTPPPPSTVSVARHVDFNVAHYTTDGIVDDSNFSLETLSRYIEELQSYERVIDHLKEAFLVVWLWRGHYPLKVAGKVYKLPLHSVTAFTWAILVTWDWNRFPAFLVFSVAWTLLATNEQQIHHPSRWRKCPTYYSLLESFLRNGATAEVVKANTNEEEIKAYDANVEKLRQRLAEEKKKEEKHELELQQELGQEIDAAEAAEEVGRKRGGILSVIVPDHPLKGVLFPVQKNARQVVMGLRIAKTVIVWKEAYYAFWVTTAALVTSAVFIWIPWSFLLRWLFRIGAILAFGPWMAIVDRKYFKMNPNMSDLERDEMLRKRLRSRYEEVLQSATNYFQRKERALKLASMKKYMFGKYAVRVPQFCEDLFDDIPLPSSSCEPYIPSLATPIEIKEIIYGQTLKGDMIPQREMEVASRQVAASQTNETKKTNILFGWTKKKLVGEETPLLSKEL